MKRAALASPCVLCGEPRRVPVLDVEGYHVLRCPRCDLHALDPMPAAAQDAFDDGSGYTEALALREPILARHHRTLASLERVVRRGRLLDVGCGPGLLLEAARDRGWTATGADVSPWSVEHARSLGFGAHLGRLEDLGLPAGSYDAIALLQVVEHLADPGPLLAECRRLLRPGGAILVATPNPRSLLARVKRERFNYWIPPVHIVWYAPATLTRLLREHGFAPARAGTWSARAPGLHDGVDVVSSFAAGRALPGRLRRLAGDAVAAIADRTGHGSITEQIALRWGDR